MVVQSGVDMMQEWWSMMVVYSGWFMVVCGGSLWWFMVWKWEGKEKAFVQIFTKCEECVCVLVVLN